MRSEAFVFFLLVVVLLTGCVRYTPKPISLEKTAAAFESLSLTNKEVIEFVAIVLTNESGPAIWNADRLTIAAIYLDPALRVAKAQLATAYATKITAKARPNPTVGVTPGYDFNAINPASPWIPGMTIDMPIETAGKRSKRLVQARYNFQAARLSLLSSIWQTRSNVQSALIQLSLANSRRAALEKQLADESTLVRLLHERLTAGAISTTEVAPFQVALIRLQSDLSVARAAAVQGTNRLAETLGLSPAALVSVSFEENAANELPANLADLRSAALKSRSDILALLARYEAAQAALRLEIAKQYPDVRLGSGYVWDQGESKWNLSLAVDIPIFNRNQGPIAEAEARRAEVAAQISEMQARVAREIDGAIATLKSAEEELQRARESLTAITRQADLARQRFTAGGADQVEVQTALLDQHAAEILTAEAQARALAARAQLESALQIPKPFMNAAFVSFLALP